ncbi:MAG TPA: ABC transporter permease [Candidatus Limnocylindrales bacterium]|nr:ABC transporter permease [Candidatus Limnocylindrales bacterium]
MTRRVAVGQQRRSFLRLMAVVARRDYLRTVRRRGFVFGTALLPAAMGGLLLLSSLFGSPPAVPAPAAALTVVNESAIPLQPATGAQLREVDRATADSELARGALGEFYIVPAGYPAAPEIQRVAASGRSPAIEDFQRWSGQEPVLAATLRLSLLADAGVRPDVAERVARPISVRDVSVDGAPSDPVVGGFGFIVPYAFTFLFVMSIFITSGYLLQSVTEEKENRVVEIVLSSVPPQPLMFGKIVGLGAAGLTQVAVWVATALIALPLAVERLPMIDGLEISPLVVGLALVFFVLGYLAYGAIFAAVGAIAPGTREAQQYSGFFGFFAVVPLLFAGAFFADPGSALVTVLAVVPLTAPAAMLQLLALSAEPPWLLVAASLLSLGAFAALAALAASRIFRATLLLYGARPSLRGILGAITARG